jgi:hypothetical protein
MIVRDGISIFEKDNCAARDDGTSIVMITLQDITLMYLPCTWVNYAKHGKLRGIDDHLLFGESRYKLLI